MTILNLIKCSEKDTSLSSFKEQFTDMISDGSWAIKRTALATHRKLPKWLATASNLKVMESGPKWDDVIKTDDKPFHKLTLNEHIMTAVGSKASAYPMVRLESEAFTVYANGKYIKLMADIFPHAEWHSQSQTKPMHLKNSVGDTIAILMPIALGRDIPGFTVGSFEKPGAAPVQGYTQTSEGLKPTPAKPDGKKGALVSFEQLEEAIRSDDYIGFCLECGDEREGCEPDAREYECESCGANKVYGAQEILIMGEYAA